MSYKPRPDFNICKSNQLESTFVEIINPKKSNIVIGCLYKHPNMDVLDFKNNYFSQIFEIVSKEQKQVFLLGDFNVNLLDYNDHQPTNDFLDSLASNSFIPYILLPTRTTSHSKTPIDNIFSNFISPEIISGNITATISDHLPQFSLVPKNLTIMKEIGQKLNKKTLYLTILIKIGLTYSKLINKMLIFLWIFFKQYKLYLGCTCSIKKS